MAPRIRNRFPNICAAGKPVETISTVKDTLQEYDINDPIMAFKHELGFTKDPPMKYNLPILDNQRTPGIYTKMRSILKPEVKTRYQQLVDDLKETPYASYWKQSDGRVADPIGAFPVGMNYKETTYGKPTQSLITVKDLINPPDKGPYHVMYEPLIGHELYRKTHNDFLPSERYERCYDPPYHPKKGWGMKTKFDPRGVGILRATHWFNDSPASVVNKIQAEHNQTYNAKLARAKTPNKTAEKLPKDYTCGMPSDKPNYGVEELLRDVGVEPSYIKRDICKSLASMYMLKRFVKPKYNFQFDLDKLKLKMRFYDTEQNNFIPLDKFYELCDCYSLMIDKPNFEFIMKHINVICCDKINYMRFNDIMKGTERLTVPKMNDIPQEHLYYKTTTESAFHDDPLYIDNTHMPIAGLPSYRNDGKVMVPAMRCKADLLNLEDDSTPDCISPNIHTRYGISYRDFFLPRSKDAIKAVFDSAGYTFEGDSFEDLWKQSLHHDKTGAVCVDTFYKFLKERQPPMELIEKEVQCP